MTELHIQPLRKSPLSPGYSAPATIRRSVEYHRVFIEQTLCTKLEDAVILQIDFDLSDIALDYTCGTVDQRAWTTYLSRTRSRVQSLDLPSDIAPLVSLVDPDEGFHRTWEALGVPAPMRQLRARWEDCPIALRFEDLQPVVLLKVLYLPGPTSYETYAAHVVVTPKEQAAQLMRMLAFLDRPDLRMKMNTVNGPSRPVAPLSWDNLVLGSDIVKLLKSDFESFWEREKWFKEANLPFRRGYLLHGPPGNGKTSAIRAMMTSQRLSGYTIRLFDPNLNDGDLEAMFAEAGRHCPSVIVFEDLDRAFPRTGETKCRLSLQSLLNCLDGLSTPEGVVVIATANEPTALDPAILRRPGRFDRVVYFPTPDRDLRAQYFRRVNSKLCLEDLASVLDESDGLSFAQLREAYIMAGQLAFERDGDVGVQGLLQAVLSLRQSNPNSQKASSGGFRP